MNEIEFKNERVRYFCEYVRDCHPSEVYEEFMKEIRKLKTEEQVKEANLAIMLETADLNAPGAKLRQIRREAGRMSALRRTNS